ncbi:MAG: cob(I)yrinic acid a,c-diamide adenosyltransferase [Anaerostipes sp.]|nr:cob(I)yrinic acid a,c-diamide adenosyltransferase [Anaerostipes sp.]MDD3746993.1 cob(I)yrinic acid a,c-diamide adenosyltransferase [Anaerostipes sp.]
MDGQVKVYYGQGKGKTSSAIGLCLRAAGQGKEAIIVQFLKGKDTEEIGFIRRLEPEVQLFSFEKYDKYYMDLSQEQKEEQEHFIRNGLNYAKKVIDTRQCDVLVLDEVLGLLDLGLLKEEELLSLLEGMDEDMEVILTGQFLPDFIKDWANSIYCIQTIKES